MNWRSFDHSENNILVIFTTCSKETSGTNLIDAGREILKQCFIYLAIKQVIRNCIIKQMASKISNWKINTAFVPPQGSISLFLPKYDHVDLFNIL